LGKVQVALDAFILKGPDYYLENYPEFEQDVLQLYQPVARDTSFTGLRSWMKAVSNMFLQYTMA